MILGKRLTTTVPVYSSFDLASEGASDSSLSAFFTSEFVYSWTNWSIDSFIHLFHTLDESLIASLKHVCSSNCLMVGP